MIDLPVNENALLLDLDSLPFEWTKVVEGLWLPGTRQEDVATTSLRHKTSTLDTLDAR